MRSYLLLFILSFLSITCNNEKSVRILKHKKKNVTQHVASSNNILAKKETPILCYHQLRDFKNSDSKRARDYIVPPSNFRDQIKRLHDSGYVTILTDQLIEYLKYGKKNSEKSVMVTFDDTDVDLFNI